MGRISFPPGDWYNEGKGPVGGKGNTGHISVFTILGLFEGPEHKDFSFLDIAFLPTSSQVFVFLW